MNNLVNTIYPSPKIISPVALERPPALDKVERPNDLKRVKKQAIAPIHNARKCYHDRNASPTYCTTLPPSPKDHIDNDPACSTCKRYPYRPFKRDTCYMLYSPQQNMWGPVCGDGGYNANWVRGNRFGVDYTHKNVFKRDDYILDMEKYNKKNPVIVSNSPYYPLTDYCIRNDPNYSSYPYYKNFALGQPTYIYPYTTIQENTDIRTVEGFEGDMKTTSDATYGFGFGMVVVLIILAILYFMRNKN